MNDDHHDYTHELIVRHRAGDAGALEELLRRYYPRIERIVRIRVGPELLARAEIGDYVGVVIERVLGSFDSYERRTDAGFIDWITRLTENEIRNQVRHMRTKKRGGALAQRVRQLADSIADLEVRAETTAVPDKVARAELIARVDGCVGLLSEQHREVIVLRLYEGFDWKTIATKMQRPTAEACQELFRRARHELLERMIEQHPGDVADPVAPGSGVFDW